MRISPHQVAAAATAVLVAALLIGRRRRLIHRRIAYLNTEDAEKWEDQCSIFSKSMGIPLDAFVKFDCFKGEFPRPENLRGGHFSGVLITGSHFSAKDLTLPWLPALFDCIRLCSTLPNVTVLGCCFGCQACAVALGGDVANNPDGSFVFGPETIAIEDPEALLRVIGGRSGPGTSLSVPRSVSLLQSHGEQVLRLPPGAQRVASSPSCTNEIFIAGSFGNVLGVQAHPEFDVPLVRTRIEPALVAKGRLNTAQLDELSVHGMRDCSVHSRLLCKMYRLFLSGSRDL